jgi:hypothetical protein
LDPFVILQEGDTCRTAGTKAPFNPGHVRVPFDPFDVIIFNDASNRTADRTHETNRIDFLLHKLHSFNGL